MNWSNSNQSIDESKFLRKTYIILVLFHRNKHSISSVKFLFHANKIKKINNWQLYKLKYIEHIFWGRKLFLTPLQKCGYREKGILPQLCLKSGERAAVPLHALGVHPTTESAPESTPDSLRGEKKNQTPQIFNRPSKVLCLKCTFLQFLITS